MEPFDTIATAIVSGAMKHVAEIGYDVTKSITSKILDIITIEKPIDRIPLEKSNNIEDVIRRLERNETLDSTDIETLVKLSNDLISSLNEQTRKRLLSSINTPTIRRLFSQHKYVNPVFSESIRNRLNQVDNAIASLTLEQYRVMRILDQVRRIKIIGTPGSGKTLMAVEQAIRSSKAGQKVMIVCHSKKLCHYIKSLIGSNKIYVDYFIGFCNRINGLEEVEEWGHYFNITKAEIDQCISRLASSNFKIDCLLVDEAQDFEEAWWNVIEKLLTENNSKLYIFTDDRQSLIPGRYYYPKVDLECDISRNCRNSGAVFDYMRRFESSLPSTEPLLKELGYVDTIDKNLNFEQNIERGIRSAANYGVLDSTVFLFGHGYEDKITKLIEKSIGLNDKYLSIWRYLILHFLERLNEISKNRIRQNTKLFITYKSRVNIANLDRQLSHDNTPNENDRKIISSTFKKIYCSTNKKYNYALYPPGFVINHYGDLCLSGIDFSAIPMNEKCMSVLANTIKHFSSNDWTFPGISNMTISFTREFNASKVNKNTIPCFHIEDFKGLESECIVLFLDRYQSSNVNMRNLVGSSRARKILIVFDQTTG